MIITDWNSSSCRAGLSLDCVCLHVFAGVCVCVCAITVMNLKASQNAISEIPVYLYFEDSKQDLLEAKLHQARILVRSYTRCLL